ncbi:hypothetical protein MAHJHV63_50090 [Mycobacterium avium subsp. hominissuis]
MWVGEDSDRIRSASRASEMARDALRILSESSPTHIDVNGAQRGAQLLDVDVGG